MLACLVLENAVGRELTIHSVFSHYSVVSSLNTCIQISKYYRELIFIRVS
jgi:hypothetical protein